MFKDKEEVKVDQTEDVTSETKETVDETEEVVDEKIINEEKKEKKLKFKKDGNKEKIQLLENEIKDLKDELLRNRAELENFKKRMKEEQVKDRKYASMNLITDLITPLEYLSKACNMQTEDANLNNFLVGFKMISQQLNDVLIQDGLEEVSTLNQPFDPTIHHAVEKVKLDDVEANLVVEELSKAYKYKDRIVKPAMVKVSE